jgi:2-(1,2-epoxy-1,2-dihydrophenyl)acetyl-CoA isomerase
MSDSSPTLADGVLHCAISVPGRAASLDGAVLAEVAATLEGDTSGIGAVLLHGGGTSFCTGGDVSAFGSATDPQQLVGDLATSFHRFLLALVATDVPVVAAVTGWAAGAGMSTALAADVIVGGPGTRFRPAYPSIGFSPDGGMSWSLPRLIGVARARDVLLTDTVVEGEQAHAWGMLTRLVPDDEVRAVALAVATALAAGPRGSHAAIKALLRDSDGRTLGEHLPAEAASIAACAASADGREGVRAFLERRPPVFG